MTSLFFLALALHASERIETSEYFKNHGFIEVTQSPLQFWSGEIPPPYAKGQLSWPVAFQSKSFSIGNSMAHFQKYGSGNAYFHGGCDLRVNAGEWVVAPVSGKIEAGEYGYSVDKDGSLKKNWKPWPTSGDPLYFEVAIIDDNGYRFEFHHVMNSSIPAKIQSLLKTGGRVETGEALAQVIVWPEEKPRGVKYHHTHYNIVSPLGVRLNPEFFSTPLDDTQAPRLFRSFYLSTNGNWFEIRNGFKVASVKEFAILTDDKLDEDYYVHPPAFVSLRIDGTPSWEWDFREFLLGPDQHFPNLTEFYVDSLSIGQGPPVKTRGDYDKDSFLIRVPVRPGLVGKAELTFSDVAGNRSILSGVIGH